VLQQLGPGHAQQEHRSAAAQVRHLLDQVEKRRFAPVDVVEDHDQRPRRGGPFQQLAHGPGDLDRGARRS